jgi:hypothetical protein
MNATETTRVNATFEEVLTIVGPPTGLLQLMASGWEDDYAFFRKIATGDWMELRNEKVTPGFWRFLITRPANVGFSPCGWSWPSEHSAFVSTRCLWAGIRLGLGPQGRHQPAPGIMPESEVTVRAKLAGATLPPSLTVHEGDRITGLWLLTESLRDSGRLRSLLHRLAYRLGWRSGSGGCATRARGGARHPLREGPSDEDGPRRNLGAHATVRTHRHRALARPRMITMMKPKPR